MFISCKDCKQGSESENIVKWVFFEILTIEILLYSKESSIVLASALNSVASFWSRIEHMSLMTTAAATFSRPLNHWYIY